MARMLQQIRRPYICRRCVSACAEAVSPTSVCSRTSRTQPSAASASLVARPAAQRTLATVTQPVNDAEGFENLSTSLAEHDQPRISVRDRLRVWEQENQASAHRLLDDLPFNERLGNFLTRPQTVRTFTDEHDTRQAKNDLYDGDVLSDLRGQTSALLAGDLVETRFGGSRLPVLAICLGRHHGLQYFYLNTGEVLAYQSLVALFTVTNYVDPAVLQPIVDLLPSEPFTRPRNVLHHVRTPQALRTAADLQGRLTKFYAEAVHFYQSSLKHMDGASEHVADPNKRTYLSLEELADRMLPAFLREGSTFSSHVLYAVHLALQRHGWGFRPLNAKWHRRNYIYEVQPGSDIALLQLVESRVRRLVDGAYLRDNPGQSASLLKQNDLGRFILRARAIVNANRRNRPWTPHGMIGPSSQMAEDLPQWEESDLKYIRFMELWACRRVIPQASQIDSLGSSILRLTQLYSESDWVAHWTAFTFLQEIGWIPPWDIPARYEYRFPDTEISRGGSLSRPSVDVEASMRPDIAAGARRDWGETKIFCVDSDQTADVDDGFSIEATDVAGEHWIHIHIADPASVIDPASPLASYIESMPSSLYLAGYPEKMLPPELEQKFSLNPGKPVLTFSAKVNEEGDVLGYNVEPGTVHNVVHMTKREVTSILPGLQSLESGGDAAFSVGKDPGPRPPVKKITTADELTAEDREGLLLLDRLGEALKDRRAAKGQLPTLQSRLPSPEVSFRPISAKQHATDPNASMAWNGDPFIKFSHSSYSQADRLVERMMHTAGEVAAKWCQSRNIPAPYSTQPEALRNAAELKRLREEVVDPLTAAGKPLPPALLQQLFGLIGTSELSAQPAPFYSVGLDAYTKASSPLRRYTDLIVHWQIHAALAHERATGTPPAVVASTTEAGEHADASAPPSLPWSHDALSRLLPALQARQRQIREVDNRDGPTQWIFQALLRAWKFGEAPLPERFAFVVDAVLPFGIRGRLRDFYGIGAVVPLARLDVGTKLAETNVGDVLTVEIRDMNTYTTELEVEPVGREDEAETEGAAGA
ncbi:mitochondrial protein cyt-4 [Verticillium dahliae]|nr:mitochondrial protein cyt-4 [Verticillium dahliae]